MICALVHRNDLHLSRVIVQLVVYGASMSCSALCANNTASCGVTISTRFVAKAMHGCELLASHVDGCAKLSSRLNHAHYTVAKASLGVPPATSLGSYTRDSGARPHGETFPSSTAGMQRKPQRQFSLLLFTLEPHCVYRGE